MTAFNWFGVLNTLKDPVELRGNLKHETLEAAKECVGKHQRSRSGFASVERLGSIKESRTDTLTGNRDQYKAL